MKEALHGPQRLPGGIMKLSESSNIDAWKNSKQCKINRGYLLPHYFDTNSNLMNESLIRTMLGEIMIGINNMDKWKHVMGLTVKRFKFPVNGQVNY